MNPISTAAPVLIVGAGPTGLVLALWLQKQGVAFKVVDADAAPGVASRAIALHARTLEFYRQLDFADQVIARGIPMDHIFLRNDNGTLADINLAEMGAGLSQFPYMLSFPQDVHEQLLVAILQERGDTVCWNTKLTDLTQDGEGVDVTLNCWSDVSQERFDYVCGCDGAKSDVRKLLGLSFPGGTYEGLFYVADVKAATQSKENPNDGVLKLTADHFAMMMPVRVTGMHRIVGILPSHLADRPDVSFQELQASLESMFDMRIEQTHWFSTYQVHHRVADKFRVDRCFIAGDAGHLHSPAGGQGMNTGIGDAVNLAWKLAAVIKGQAKSAILDTYNPERIEFARRLVATTDTAFVALVSKKLMAKFLRTLIIPFVLPRLTRTKLFKRLAFKTVSQIAINYRKSALSMASHGQLRAGDRLPWVRTSQGDNYEVLRSLRWRLHVYGLASGDINAASQRFGLELNQFEWNKEMEATGLLKDHAYLLRPDGHVAAILGGEPTSELDRFFAPWGIASA